MLSARKSAHNDCHASAAREKSTLQVQSETTCKIKHATHEFYYDRFEQ